MEHLAAVLHRNSATALTGLRYFNVFGPRQNPDGPYSAVIPAGSVPCWPRNHP